MTEEKKEKEDQLPAVSTPIDVFARFDQLDDEIIVSELENRVIDTWVYHFPQEGHEVWGLAKVGIDECAKKLGQKGIALRDDELTCEPDPSNPEYMLFTAKVLKVLVSPEGHEARVEAAIGTKRQWIMMLRKKDQKPMTNKFWFEQGSMKALRNARSRLIPEEIKANVIANAKKIKGKVRRIEPDEPVKKETKPAPGGWVEQTKPEYPDESRGQFPDSEERPETGEKMEATQLTLNKLQRLEAVLVDKYKFTARMLWDRIEEDFGITDLVKISQNMATDVIRFLEETVEWNEKRQTR